MWTDSHCHLHDEEDALGGYRRAIEAGVDRLVLIGTGEESSRRAVAVAGELCAHSEAAAVYATIGQHPHDATSGITPIAALLSSAEQQGLLRGDPGGVVAVGECGLDYHYEHSPRAAQLEVFAAQLDLASRHELAVVVHTREAWEDTFSLLEEVGIPSRLVIHCFTGGPKEARRCLDLGAYLSFSGIVTFKNASEVREAAMLCPLDRLLTETDAPYLAPVPYRGRPNEPAFVGIVGEALAALRGEPVTDLARQSSSNAAAVFGLSG